MKKMTLASFVFMVVLVTGASALNVGKGNNNLNSTATTAQKNLQNATNALAKLEDSSTSNFKKCKAYDEVKKYCKEILDDDSSSDENKNEADGILNDADNEIQSTAINCEKEKKCKKMITNFEYKLNEQDNNSNELENEEKCSENHDN